MNTYYKFKDKVYNEEIIENDECLNVFGPMDNDSFLCRILNCYGIFLNYDLDQKKLIITDIKNNENLKEERYMKFVGNDVSMTISIDDKILFFNIYIKRKSTHDVALKLLAPIIDENISDNNEIELFKVNYSKYGACSILNPETNNSFSYTTTDLHNYIIASNNFENNYDVVLHDQSHVISYNFNGKELTTNIEFSKNNMDKVTKTIDGIIDPTNYYHYFPSDLIPYICELLPVIDADLKDLSKLTTNSLENNNLQKKLIK